MKLRELAAFALAALVAAAAAPGPATADQHEENLVTFAGREHLALAQAHSGVTCPVCGAQRLKSTLVLEVAGGRYTFENVEQYFCPVCHVTTLNLRDTRKAAHFIRLLNWRLPAARDQIVLQGDRYEMALQSSAKMPFIGSIVGLRKMNGQVFFEVH